MADVTINGSGPTASCTVNLGAISAKVRQSLLAAMKDAYSNFSIDQADLYDRILGALVTREKMCAIFTAKSLRNGESAYDVHRRHKTGFSAADASRRGVFVTSTKPRVTGCSSSQEGYRRGASVMKNCKNFRKIVGGTFILTGMYALGGLSEQELYKLLADAKKMGKYGAFDRGPEVCEKGKDYEVIYAERATPGTNIKYALKTWIKGHFMHWRTEERTQCKNLKVTEYFDYNFGFRAAVPVSVTRNGQTSRQLIVFKQNAGRRKYLHHRPPNWLEKRLYRGVEFLQKTWLQATAGHKN